MSRGARTSDPAARRRSRRGVFSRTAAAIAGGYAVAASSAAMFASLLPLSRVEATVAGTLLSIVVYVCAAMWAFAAPTALRAWLGILGPAVVAIGLTFLTWRSV